MKALNVFYLVNKIGRVTEFNNDWLILIPVKNAVRTLINGLFLVAVHDDRGEMKSFSTLLNY
ncbi:hypothetical protein FD28_GL002276 [Levilactobacillus hammesii DSM 16381]|uniref:Uncharacterized protein n=1 Tax=Levilactobacillus hammesii DSM 16381 TaxID=1423753 RepID=A0A0R1UV14_9LACO|nr:hypothetical protein FD28_GL002276 [Levilactobacillus hammesii DSM 16381]